MSILRSIKSGVYETVMAATRVDQWVAEYATNHDLSHTPVPAATRSFDVRVVGFVLEDAWSNALKYGDGTKFRPELSAQLPEGRIELSVTNRQMPGKRLPGNADVLFERGVTGTQATLLSEGFGLADARQTAEAAGGTVSLEEHLRGDVWFTTFTVSLPALRLDCASVDVAPEPLMPEKVGAPEKVAVPPPALAASRYRVGDAAAGEGGEAAAVGEAFPKALTVLACDDERTQRRVLEKIFLGKLDASPESVVLGADLEEIQSVVSVAKILKPDIVILDQNLIHGNVIGAEVADELRAAGFDGFIVLRTGSTAEGLRRLQNHASVDLAIGKGARNLDVVDAIKRGYNSRARARRGKKGRGGDGEGGGAGEPVHG